MSQKNILIITVVVLVTLAVYMGIDFLNATKKEYVSPHILSLTQPIKTFSGVVKKVEGTIISISQGEVLGSGSTSPIPDKSENIYQVKITDKTRIEQVPGTVNYQLKTNTNPPETSSSINNIHNGQYVTVETNTDLRKLKGNTVEASVIHLPPTINTIYGNVVRTDKNTLIMRAYPPTETKTSIDQKEKEYHIAVNEETEITRFVYDPNLNSSGSGIVTRVEQLSLSNLTTNSPITVYVDGDATIGTEFTALRIEPSTPAVIATPPPSLTPAAK